MGDRGIDRNFLSHIQPHMNYQSPTGHKLALHHTCMYTLKLYS